MSTIIVQIIQLNSTLSNDNDENIFHVLTDRIESFNCFNGNAHSCAPIVIWFGQQDSSLRKTLITYLTVEDITLILFSNEDHLWEWLDSNSSQTIASLVLQPIERSLELISQCHNYVCIRSILVRSQNHDYTVLQSLLNPYSIVDGVFQDDTRLLIKLIANLILFSEELGDNNIEIERNYDRSLKLCALLKEF